MKSYNDMYSINDSKLQSSNACHLIHFAKLSNANKLSFQLSSLLFPESNQLTFYPSLSLLHYNFKLITSISVHVLLL